MILDRGDQVLVHRLGVAGGSESSIAGEAPGASGDLAHFLGIEPAAALAVELAQAREGHMVDVHVQPHADGVGGDQEVHLAGLVERDLGVARAGAQRAHHHGGATPLAAHQLGDGVDRLGGEGDDGAAAGQAGQFLRSGIAQGRQPLAENDLGLRQQAAHQGRHGPRPQQHGLGLAAGVQQPLGEDVAALWVGAELDLVHRQEGDVAAQRHGLDGADEIDGVGRDDLFLASDQGDPRLAPDLDHAVVDFPRQQPQRQADHAALVRQHAFHGKVRLAGIGRPQDRHDP